MELLLLFIFAGAIAVGVRWSRKNFRSEIDRARRIRRANRDGRP